MALKTDLGFTLLELTAAMLVTSLIALAVASSLAGVSSGWDRGEKRAASSAAMEALDRRLSHKLAALDMGPFGAWPDLTGGSEEIAFTSLGTDGPRRVEFSLHDGDLILSTKPLRVPGAPAAAVLLTGITRLEFSYYDPAERAWRDEWRTEGNSRPPSLIRLELALQSQGGERRLSPLVFPVGAGRVYSARGMDPLE